MSFADFQPPASDAPIDWALAYASAGMAIFPVGANKKPLTAHGLKDASTNDTAICSWWRKWRHADIGWAVPADVVVVDLDRKGSSDGLQDFHAHGDVGVDDVPTPQASTPTGGRHLVYSANGSACRNGVRVNGSAIDIRTGGGYIVLPGPRNGRAWLKPLSTPLATISKWIQPPQAKVPPETTSRASSSVSAYGRAALGRASRAIETAENGAQEHTLNRECFSIGTLVGAGEIDELTALEALTAASYRMPAYAEPWGELNEKVRRSVEQGMARPRIRIAAKRTELVDTILETDPLPPKPTNAPREKKEIVLRVGETERIVDEIETALIAARRGLYRRGGLIVATAFDEIQTWDGKTTRARSSKNAANTHCSRTSRPPLIFSNSTRKRTASAPSRPWLSCAPSSNGDTACDFPTSLGFAVARRSKRMASS